MSKEFYVDENISGKHLNHQSTSLVVPQIFRNKVFSSMYYKVNLTPASLRGDTLVELVNIMVRDFGSINDRKFPQVFVCGGVEFKCILMKLINIRPSWDQLQVLLEPKGNFNEKYMLALVLCYLRISYYFVSSTPELGITSQMLTELFKKYSKDYRKIKSIPFEDDCWSPSSLQDISVLHVDELVEYLCEMKQIWGIPLGKSQWCEFWDDDSETSETDTTSDDSETNDSETLTDD